MLWVLSGLRGIPQNKMNTKMLFNKYTLKEKYKYWGYLYYIQLSEKRNTNFE